MGADLKNRIATRHEEVVVNGASNAGSEVAPLDNLTTLRTRIERMQPEFAKAMPKGTEAVQLVRDAQTALRTVRNLDKCDPPSVLGALMTCAQLGLRPHVMGQAYVLPYYSKRDKAFHAQFVVGYPGLVELAHSSGRIADLSFRPVYDNDDFDIDYGSGNIRHKPSLRGKRGEAYGYYALVRYPNGGATWFYMSKEDAQEYRDKFATTRDRNGNITGPWLDHFDAMAAKSCFRQLAKFIPKTRELATAIAADETLRINLDPEADAAAVSTHLEVIDGAVAEREDNQG